MQGAGDRGDDPRRPMALGMLVALTVGCGGRDASVTGPRDEEPGHWQSRNPHVPGDPNLPMEPGFSVAGARVAASWSRRPRTALQPSTR